MKRKLTAREIILIALLCILGGAAAYYWLWYKPVTDEIAANEARKLATEEAITVAEAKTVELTRMKAELEAMFSGGANPVSMAKYDNIKPLMKELNQVLRGTQNFSITFDTVNDNTGVVRRAVTLNFTAASYADAKRIIDDLHNSKYRSLIKTLVITAGSGTLWPGKEMPSGAVNPDEEVTDEETVTITPVSSNATNVSVSMTLIFYEFNEAYVPAPTPAPAEAA